MLDLDGVIFVITVHPSFSFTRQISDLEGLGGGVNCIYSQVSSVIQMK